MPNSCFINNYFTEGLKTWEANADIQLVFSHPETFVHLCAYFSKADPVTSDEACHEKSIYLREVSSIQMFSTRSCV